MGKFEKMSVDFMETWEKIPKVGSPWVPSQGRSHDFASGASPDDRSGSSSDHDSSLLLKPRDVDKRCAAIAGGWRGRAADSRRVGV